MSIFRRKREASGAAVEATDAAVLPETLPQPQQTVPPQRATTHGSLNANMDVLLERLTQLEFRVSELVENAAHAPSHGDLLDVRIHSAKLAAELTRTVVELRGEINIATDKARDAAIETSTRHTQQLVADAQSPNSSHLRSPQLQSPTVHETTTSDHDNEDLRAEPEFADEQRPTQQSA